MKKLWLASNSWLEYQKLLIEPIAHYYYRLSEWKKNININFPLSSTSDTFWQNHKVLCHAVWNFRTLSIDFDSF